MADARRFRQRAQRPPGVSRGRDRPDPPDRTGGPGCHRRARVADPGAAVPHLASALHRIGRPALLVLDDVHRLHDPTCLDALAALLDHLPPGFQLAILSRSVPDLPLARLRADRRLLEIGQLDLALDASETQELTAAAGHRLAGDQARTLPCARRAGRPPSTSPRSRAGGAMRRQPGSGVSGRDAYIAEYLRTELLDHLRAMRTGGS